MLKNATKSLPSAGLAAAESAAPGRFRRDTARSATAAGMRLQSSTAAATPQRSFLTCSADS